MWEENVVPIVGALDILVYPYGDDINDSITSTYDGEKFETLYNVGFRVFVGMNNDMPASGLVADTYFRQTRRWVTGAKLAYASETFSDLFNASTVLSTERGDVPADE